MFGSSGTDEGSKKRRLVIKELIDTERTYLRDMSVLKTYRDECPMSSKDKTVIFSNFELIEGVNLALMTELLGLHKDPLATPKVGHIGPVFLHFADYMKMYSEYCSNYPTAIESLVRARKSSPDLAKWLDAKALDPSTNSLSLDAYLVKPVQRICKYPLLLRELIRTTPTTHQDHQPLTAALEKLNAVVATVNENRRDREARDEVLNIQDRVKKSDLITPSRRLVHHDDSCEIRQLKSGALDKGKLAMGGKRAVYVFNDTVLVSRKSKHRFSHGAEEEQKNSIPISSCFVFRYPNLPWTDSDAVCDGNAKSDGSPASTKFPSSVTTKSPASILERIIVLRDKSDASDLWLIGTTAPDITSLEKHVLSAISEFEANEQKKSRRTSTDRPPEGLFRVISTRFTQALSSSPPALPPRPAASTTPSRTPPSPSKALPPTPSQLPSPQLLVISGCVVGLAALAYVAGASNHTLAWVLCVGSGIAATAWAMNKSKRR